MLAGAPLLPPTDHSVELKEEGEGDDEFDSLSNRGGAKRSPL